MAIDLKTADLSEIYEHSAQALGEVYRPGRAVHLAIDWQRLYCDSQLPTTAHNDRSLMRTIAQTLARASDFADDMRPSTPTWWVYHDPVLDERIFPLGYFICSSADRKARKIAAIREQGLEICGRVDPEADITLRKPFRDAFSGTDLDERLKRRGIDTLLISGLYRHYSYNPKRSECVGQTMKAAADLGYKTFVVEDLTVGHTENGERTRLNLARMALGEGAYSVTANHVHRVVGGIRADRCQP